MTQSKTPRTIRARRLLTLGTAAVGLAAPAVSGTPPVGAGYPNPYHNWNGLTGPASRRHPCLW